MRSSIDRDTRHERLRKTPSNVRILPCPLVRRSDHDLHSASVLHIVLYMSCQRRLPSKIYT